MSEIAYIIGGIVGMLIFGSMVLRFFIRPATTKKSPPSIPSEKRNFEIKVVCPACGAENKQGDNFCGGCGSVLPTVAQSMEQMQIEHIDSSPNKGVEKLPATIADKSIDELKIPLDEKNHTASETVSTIYCPKCGRANEPDLIYCKYDLAVLYPGSQQCPKCRRSIPVNTRFCVHCGTHVPK